MTELIDTPVPNSAKALAIIAQIIHISTFASNLFGYE